MKCKSVVMTSVAAAALVALVSLGSAGGSSGPTYASGTGEGMGMMGKMKMALQNHHMDGHGQMSGQGHMGGQSHMGGNAAMALDLDVDDVRKIIEGRLVMHGNDRMKAGKIEILDDDTIVAEIVTVDDSLVFKLAFDRKTGAHRPAK